MFLNITSLELVMMLAIILAGGLLLVFVYQAYKGRGRGGELLPVGIVLLSTVVIIDKLFFSGRDFLDWMTIIVFVIGAVAGIKMILQPAERRD